MGATTLLEPAGSYSKHRPEGEPRTDYFYDFVELIYRASGIFDYTDGYYEADDITYEQAQVAQAQLLLREAGCTEGSRLLDVGCGAGSLLSAAAKLGAAATGITVSQRQVRYCQQQGLRAILLDYRDIPQDWNTTYDCVVANGSIEHFVSPSDVLAGRDDDIYRHLFSTVHRLLDPASLSRRFVTTVMHFNRVHCQPHQVLKGPFAHLWGSDEFHSAYVQRVLGGWCVTKGQLERCSQGYFRLITKIDGTDDYRRTSEEWFRRIRRTMLRSWRGVPVYVTLLPYLFRCPRHVLLTLGIMLTGSWEWLFQGKNPPACLLRHTWEAI